MLMRWAILYSLLFLCILGTAEGKQQIELIDADTGTTLKEVIVHLDLLDNQQQPIKQVVYVKDILTMPASSPSYVGSMLIDDPKTPAPDYYFSGSLIFETDQISLTFVPIASVRGEVYDKSDTLVSIADLSFRCDRFSNLPFPSQTDKYGSFTTYLPVGTCILMTSKDRMTGQETVVAERGESYDLVISLDQSLPRNYSWIIILLIALALIVWFARTRKIPPSPRKGNKPAPSKEVYRLLKTLDENEKKIVQALLGERKAIPASQLRHRVKIPKTSFTRIVERLQRKQIISIESDGFFKKIKLADWVKK